VTALRVWNRWTSPIAQGEVARRREAVLFQVLAAMVVLSGLTMLVQMTTLATTDTRAAAALWFVVNLAVGASFYGLLVRARSGRPRQSAAALVALFAALALLMTALGGVDHAISSVLAAATVLLAAVLLGDETGLLAALGLGAVYTVLGAVQGMGVLGTAGAENEVVTAVETALVICVCAVVCRTYTREALVSIDSALTHGSEASPLRQLRTKHLSLREIEVVQLVAAGLSNDAIAGQLFVSPRTVQSHVANAMKKTDSSNRTELGVLAVREGLVPLDHHD
jgi:two-component system, NarL family, response regulator LiaR